MQRFSKRDRYIRRAVTPPFTTSRSAPPVWCLAACSCGPYGVSVARRQSADFSGRKCESQPGDASVRRTANMVFEMAVMMHVDRCLLGEFVRSLRQEDTAGTDRKSSDIARQRLERDQRPVPRIVIGKRRELGLVGVRKFYF